MKSYIGGLILAWAAASIGGALAAVQDATASTFRIRQVLPVAASPEQLYSVLIHVETWWDSAHTYSGKASNLHLNAVAGGCFCERLPGGSVQHLQVVYVDAPKRMVLSGALGPLQALGVSGAVTFSLKPTSAGTELSFSYNVGGNLGDMAAQLPAAVDKMWESQLLRLKRAAEAAASRH